MIKSALHVVDTYFQTDAWEKVLGNQGEEMVCDVFNQVSNHILSLKDTSQRILSLVLCCSEFIQVLNRDHRGKDKATNCLSFPSGLNYVGGEIHPIMVGEVFLALEVIEEEARSQNKNFKDHFIHLLVHSILHLYGYDHMTEEESEIMEALEVEILSKYYNISDPYLI